MCVGMGELIRFGSLFLPVPECFMANPQMPRSMPVVQRVLENNALLALHSNLHLRAESRKGYEQINQAEKRMEV